MCHTYDHRQDDLLTDRKDTSPDYLYSYTVFEGLAMSGLGFSIESGAKVSSSSHVGVCVPNTSSAGDSHITARALGDESDGASFASLRMEYFSLMATDTGMLDF